MNNTDAMIAHLHSLNYKVIKPLALASHFYDKDLSSPTLKLAVVDTETTGVNLNDDKIIELAIIVAEYCSVSGKVFNIVKTYDSFEDPNMAIPEKATKVHGITNEMVCGQKIIDADVISLLSDVSLIVAHNASFDRPFLEKRLPLFKEKQWACTFAQIPWKEFGFSSASLEFIAYKFGFHFDAHRALTDCHALLTILNQRVDNTSALKFLLEKTNLTSFKLTPLQSPFESKDLLKSRGYKWNPVPKTWSVFLDSLDSLEAEQIWLKENIYKKQSFSLEKETIDAFIRFSSRSGQKEVILT